MIEDSQEIEKHKLTNFIHLDIQMNLSEDPPSKYQRQCPKMQLRNYRDKTNIKRNELISYKRKSNNIRLIPRNGKILSIGIRWILKVSLDKLLICKERIRD